MAIFHRFGRKRYRRTDGRTDQPTDKASYRDARTHLKKTPVRKKIRKGASWEKRKTIWHLSNLWGEIPAGRKDVGMFSAVRHNQACQIYKGIYVLRKK